MATYSWNFTTRVTCAVLLLDTPTLHPDWLIAAPCLLWLVTCSLSANLLSSSRLISSSLRWGPFSCCLTISRSFLCCWERTGTRKREMSVVAMFPTGEYIMDNLLKIKSSLVLCAKGCVKDIKGECRAQMRGCESFSHKLCTNTRTHNN